MRLPTFVLATVLIAAGCAGGSSMATSGAAPQPIPSRGSMNLIGEQEIAAASADFMNAFDLVQGLRPSMMRPRGKGTATGSQGNVDVVAYLGEMRLGAVSSLASVVRGQILEIRYWTATEATQRWGTGHASGAIQVIQRK